MENKEQKFIDNQIKKMPKDMHCENAANLAYVKSALSAAISFGKKAGREEGIKEMYFSATLYSDGSASLMRGYLERVYPEMFKALNTNLTNNSNE